MTTLSKARTGALLATIAAVALPGAAAAATSAETTTALNLRTGPGPQYEIATTMPAGADVALGGCEASGNWCQVSWQKYDGWASSRYLRAAVGGETVAVREGYGSFPTVTFDRDTAVATAGGAVVGALVGGPVGAVAGGAAGAAYSELDDPPDRVDTYVRERPGDPVYLEGEVVVGAGVPREVQLSPIPQYDYQYAYVNGQRVLVDPDTRQIVYVYR